MGNVFENNVCEFLVTVLSNDKLYGADEEFLNVLDEHATNIVRELLVVLKALGEAKEAKRQYNLCIEVLWRVIARGDLEAQSMFTLATNLWVLAEKLRDTQSSKLSVSIINYYLIMAKILLKIQILMTSTKNTKLGHQ